MAVIRQQRQNITKPIGVIRADTGLSEQWASVGRLADTMIESSFNELKREAKEKGIETAQAASAASIRTIDPITGEPEAFNIPSGFGVAARTAYQDIIERRYVSQTEKDFEAEAQRLAILYQNDSNGVAKFKTDFGTYIENAKGTAVPKFANIIENIGSAMLASNSLNLMSKQSKQQHEENRQQIELDVNDYANKIESLIALGDPQSLEDANNASVLAEELINKNVDGDVQFISKVEAKKLKRTISLAKARGLTRRINKIILDDKDLKSGDINDLQIVLQTGNVENISNLPESLQDVASELMSNEDFNTHFDAINTDLRGIQSDLGQSETDERMRQADIEQEEKEKEADEKVQLKLGIKPDAQKVNDTLDKHIKSGDLFAAQDTLNAWFGKLDSIAQKLESDIDTTAAKKSTRQLLFDRLIKDVNGVTNLQEATNFRDYIDNEGDLDVDLPDDVRAIADFIIKNAEFDVDRDSIGSDTDAVVRSKAAIIKANSLSESKQRTRQMFANGIGSPTTKSHQNEIEEIILNGRPSSFFLTADAINTQEEWKPKVLASGGVIPSTIVGIVKSAGSGMVDDPARINLAVSYFGMFSSVRVKGSAQETNLWQNVMSAEQFSAFEETLYAASMSENGINDFPKIAATLSDVVNNKDEYNQKVKRVLDEGETLDGLLESIVGTSNPNVLVEMNSYLKYKIASGNKDKDTIVSDITRYYEQHYHDTQGVVVDPSFGLVGKSRQALSGVFGDNVLPAVNYLNKVVTDLGIKDARFGLSYEALAREQLMPKDTYQNVISEEIGTEDIQTVKGKTRLQLMPLPSSGTVTENVQYMAVVLDKDGGLEPFTYTSQDDKGNVVTNFLYVNLDDIKRGVAR